MTGTARSSLAFRSMALLALAVASIDCGSPSAEAASPASPSAPLAAPNAPPSPAAAAPRSDDPTKPSNEKGWPFAPAPSAEELSAQLDRLGKDQGPIKTNWTPPGKTDRYGHAEGLIGAPYDAVKARLLDFAHYKELAGPKFKKVSVVDKSASGTDLYFQLPIMNGLVTIWYVTRFAAARPAQGGADVIEGNFVKGNIKNMQIVFALRPGPAQSTILVCDLNLAINLPAPQAALDEELRDACGDAVNALRARLARGD